MIKEKLKREEFCRQIGVNIFHLPRVPDFEKYFCKNLFNGMSVQEIWDKYNSY